MMTRNHSKNQQSDNSGDSANLATNTFYSFLLNFGSHFFTFIYSFLYARLFTDDIYWDYLIIATSYITIIVIITSLLPPGLNVALNYYIPRYIALNQKSRLKSFIKNAFIIKLLFLIPIFIISIFIFSYFFNYFEITLESKKSLLFILSPLIFIHSLNFILDGINRGFSRFNFIFLLLLVKNAIHIFPLLIFFIFDFSVDVEIIAVIIMVSILIPFIFNCLFILVKIIKIKSIESEVDSFKKDIHKTFKYGSYIGFTDIIGRLGREAQIQGIAFTGGAVTGFNIARNYKSIGHFSVASFYYPLLNSFTSLNTKKDYDQIKKIYKITFKINLFLLLIISGVLLFCVDFVLDFVFLESRLKYSILLVLIQFASIFTILGIFLQTFLNAKNKVKIPFLLQILYLSYSLPLFYIGLIYFGVEGAIILGLIIGNIISLIIQLIVTYKIGKIKLNIKKIVIQYLAFFIPLFITIFLRYYILRDASFKIIQNLGLSLFKNFDFLSIITFLILFIFINLVFKTIRSSDIKYFESLLNKNRFLDKTLIKGLNILKKFTRD